MITLNACHIRRNQKGLALLVLVIAISLAISAYYFSSISMVAVKVDNIEKTRTALKRAKRALIDYALINWYTTDEGGKFGKLPCPDQIGSGTEGIQDGPCGNAYNNAIGLFPWLTLGTEVLKDTSGSCLLYVVSPAYKTTPLAALNPDSYGQIRIVDENGDVIQGSTPEDRPIAVIFAPGKVVSGQSRNFDVASSCGLDYGNIAAYLDDDGTTNNAAVLADNSMDVFVQAYPGSMAANNAMPVNDQLITITHEEFWGALKSTVESVTFESRMTNLTEAIALCFAAYGANNTNHLPMPAPTALAEYRRSSLYDDANIYTSGFSGRLPYNVSNANVRIPGATGNEDVIYKNSFCNNLVTSFIPGQSINFQDDNGDDSGAYFDMVGNWKDHFFYAVSKSYNPAAAALNCSDGCVKVSAVEYAAIIIYSGLKRPGQVRYGPPFDFDNKSDVSMYLENGREVFFPENTGDQVYPVVDSVTSNDIMYCIRTDMGVEAC